MKLKIFATLGLFAMAAVTQAANVSVNDVTIAPGTPTVQVPVLISPESDGELISGMNLSFAAGEAADAIDILETGNEFDGTIWDNHPGGFIAAFADAPGPFTHNALAAISLLGADLDTTPDGLLATFTLDTAALAEGTYDLNANFVSPESGVGSSAFLVDGAGLQPINLNFDSGVLTVIPEPSTVVLTAIFGCLGLGVFMKRRRG